MTTDKHDALVYQGISFFFLSLRILSDQGNSSNFLFFKAMFPEKRIGFGEV